MIPPETEYNGYYLSHAGDGGESSPYCLAVAIRDIPTAEHYDPESLRLSLLTADGTVQESKLTRHLSLSQEKKVCPGPVHLMDRLGKRVTFFSFGGSLRSLQEEDRSLFVLQSPVPILEMEEDQASFQNLLAAESEAQLAKIHADWESDDAGFLLRLVQTDSRQLFRALVGAIYRSERESPTLFQEYPTFSNTLQQWATDWSIAGEESSTLDELLAPSDL
jgi:hypothetical protein